MAERELIALRAVTFRGRKLAAGATFHATRGEAEDLVRRRLARLHKAAASAPQSAARHDDAPSTSAAITTAASNALVPRRKLTREYVAARAATPAIEPPSIFKLTRELVARRAAAAPAVTSTPTAHTPAKARRP